MKILSVDLGGSYMKYGVVDESATILEKDQVPSPVVGVQSFIDAVTGVYQKYAGQVEGVAISLPGAIDDNTGFARTAGAFMDLYGENIFDLLKENIPVPIAVENDGKCGALAEVWKGSLEECQDGVVVIIGTGLAGGLIKNRRLHKGKNLAAGEFSCLMVKPGDVSMQNMMVGPAAMAGLTMAVAMAKGIDMSTLETAALTEHIKEKEGIDLGKEMTGEAGAEDTVKAESDSQVKVDGPQIFRWLEEGDPVVTAIYQNFISHLSLLAYNLQVIYDPDKIVFGGGVSRQPRLVKDIQAEMEHTFQQLGSMGIPLPMVKPEIAACKFTSDANLVGAVYNYLIHHAPELAK